MSCPRLPPQSGHNPASNSGVVVRGAGLTTTFATTALCTLPAVAQDNPTKASLTSEKRRAIRRLSTTRDSAMRTAQLADPDFFAEDNQPLISLFRSLSDHGVLRIGGNSSEFCWWKTRPDDHPPQLPASAHGDENWMPHTFTAVEPVAIDRLEGFLRATGWNCIYGLNLGVGSPDRCCQRPPPP